MSKWQLLVVIVSAVQLLWGVREFVDYGRSVGAVADATDGWVYCGLGLSGLTVLAVPRYGIPVAIVQFLAAGYAVCWLLAACSALYVLVWLWWLALLGLQPPAAGPAPAGPSPIAQAILMTAGATALLCLLSAVGTWRIARQASRS